MEQKNAHSGFPYWENGCFHCRLTCPVCSLVSPWCTVRCRCASSGCVCVCVRGGTRVTRGWELRQHLLPGLPCEVYISFPFVVLGRKLPGKKPAYLPEQQHQPTRSTPALGGSNKVMVIFQENPLECPGFPPNQGWLGRATARGRSTKFRFLTISHLLAVLV